MGDDGPVLIPEAIEEPVPAPRNSWTTPGASPLRRRVEEASRKPLIYAAAAPRWVLFLVFAALAVGGGLLPVPYGVVRIAVLALAVGWLIFLSWPGLPRTGRPARLLVLALLVAAAVARALTG
jgi:hypothetical protein